MPQQRREPPKPTDLVAQLFVSVGEEGCSCSAESPKLEDHTCLAGMAELVGKQHGALLLALERAAERHLGHGKCGTWRAIAEELAEHPTLRERVLLAIR